MSFVIFSRKYSSIDKRSAQTFVTSITQYLVKLLPLFSPVTQSFNNKEKTLCFNVSPNDLFFCLKVLKLNTNTQFSSLTFISGVDYPFRHRRFEIVYDLLSVRFNKRLRLKTFIDEITPLISCFIIYPSSTWWEREIWDMFGVFFLNNVNMRRLLTDYGFDGHPLRKDFPLSGFVEARFNFKLKRVCYSPLEHAQEFRVFDFSTGWSKHSITNY